MTIFQCPNCGTPSEPAFSTVKMMTCASCGTTLFLMDDAAKKVGEQGVMHDVPLLFGLNDHIKLGKDTYHIVGHARYSYGRGTWDEFCALDGQGQPIWVSVDEGDIVVQHEIPVVQWPRYDGRLKLGMSFSYSNERFTVTEDDTADCVALRGSFDTPLLVGDRYRFLNMQGSDGALLSAEIDGDQQNWFIGRWFDSFEVEVLS